jgi:ABC-type multidrug transport system ATPase subunit
MIERSYNANKIQLALQRSRIVALIGLHKSGKTTLACIFVSTGSLNYFDHEDPANLWCLEEMMMALSDLTRLV